MEMPMTNADMIEAMARAMEGHGSLQGAATAALAVVQPEIDRLRAENARLRSALEPFAADVITFEQTAPAKEKANDRD